MKKPGIVIVPDHSNGPKTKNRPKNCHCHCPIMVTGVTPTKLIASKVCGDKHYGKGGWWKNDDCLYCINKI